MVTPQIAILLVDKLNDDKWYVEEIIRLAIPIAISYFSFGIPFALSILHILTGLFSSTLVFLIHHWVSNISIVIIGFIILILLTSLGNSNTSSNLTYTALAYTGLAALWEWIKVTNSVEALRYVDPEWNLEPPGGNLCPSLFYVIGICEYWEDPDEQHEEQIAVIDPADDIDRTKETIGQRLLVSL